MLFSVCIENAFLFTLKLLLMWIDIYGILVRVRSTELKDLVRNLTVFVYDDSKQVNCLLIVNDSWKAHN